MTRFAGSISRRCLALSDTAESIEQPDSINEFAVVGEFGFRRCEGPWTVEKEGTKWTIIVPYEEMNHALNHRDEGCAVALIADGIVVGGGLIEAVFDPEDEGEQHVIVDQYAMGDSP